MHWGCICSTSASQAYTRRITFNPVHELLENPKKNVEAISYSTWMLSSITWVYWIPMIQTKKFNPRFCTGFMTSFCKINLPRPAHKNQCFVPIGSIVFPAFVFLPVTPSWTRISHHVIVKGTVHCYVGLLVSTASPLVIMGLFDFYLWECPQKCHCI